MVRRRPGTLVGIELRLLEAALDLVGSGQSEFYGLGIARRMEERDSAGQLVPQGTLYGALERMRQAGYLESRWEDPLIAEGESRPIRRLYTVTTDGLRALARTQAAAKPQTAARLKERPVQP